MVLSAIWPHVYCRVASASGLAADIVEDPCFIFGVDAGVITFYIINEAHKQYRLLDTIFTNVFVLDLQEII